MKKIFLGVIALSLVTASCFASDGGGKKKRKKAKTECVASSCCDPKDCKKDEKCPPNCDPKDCKPVEKCTTATAKCTQ